MVSIGNFISTVTLKTGSAVITPVTDGMTLNATWDSIGTGYNDLASVLIASAKVVANFSSSDDGILMEAGGTGFGVILYVYDGRLYFRCGNGNGLAESNADTSQVSYTLSGGARDYIIEWSSNATTAALYVNGTLVGTSNRTSSAISGGDAGGIGRVYNSIPTNLGGWTTDGQGSFSGTIDRAEIFNNQVTSDI